MNFSHKLMSNNFEKNDFIRVKKLISQSNPIFDSEQIC